MPLTAELSYYPKPGNSSLVARNIQVAHECDGNGNPGGAEPNLTCKRTLRPGSRILEVSWIKGGGARSGRVTYHCRECALNHFRVRHLEEPKG